MQKQLQWFTRRLWRKRRESGREMVASADAAEGGDAEGEEEEEEDNGGTD